MTRLSLILFFVLMLSGLSLVNSHHQARKLYIALEQLGEDAKLYQQEYGQLQLEQSTWAMHSRVELIATSQLQMQVPDQKRIQVVAMTATQTRQRNPATEPTDKMITDSATDPVLAPLGEQD